MKPHKFSVYSTTTFSKKLFFVEIDDIHMQAGNKCHGLLYGMHAMHDLFVSGAVLAFTQALEVNQIVYPRENDRCNYHLCKSDGTVALENKQLTCGSPPITCENGLEPVLHHDANCNCQWECQCKFCLIHEKHSVKLCFKSEAARGVNVKKVVI